MLGKGAPCAQRAPHNLVDHMIFVMARSVHNRVGDRGNRKPDRPRDQVAARTTVLIRGMAPRNRGAIAERARRVRDAADPLHVELE